MIYLYWPTVRPQMAAERARKWIERSKNGFKATNFKLIFGPEEELDCKPILDLGFKDTAIIPYKSPYHGVCYTATKLTQLFDGNDDDIIILASDDFEPHSAYKWDEEIVKAFAATKKGCIVNDGYKPQTNIVAMPIITGRLFNALNRIIYNPAYHHFYSDQEFYDILVEVNEIEYMRDPSKKPLFEHKHYSFNGRQKDKNDSNNQTNWSIDQKTYDARKSLPLHEKLKLPEWFTNER